jgi:tetratricopeptide (TPR) repeat protein
MLLKAEAYASAYADFRRSAELDPEREAALTGLVEAATGIGRLPEAERFLESLGASRPQSTTIPLALARLFASTGAPDRAVEKAQQAIAVAPDNPLALETLASILADVGDLERLRPLSARMKEKFPDREETWYQAAMVSFLEKRWPETVESARRTLAINRQHVPAHNLFGIASVNLGHLDVARQAFRAALEAGPHEASTYANLGLLELQSGNADLAVEYFTEALILDPEQPLALANFPVAQSARRRY